MMTKTKTTQEYFITGMDCADCASTVKNGVSKLEGVTSCEVSFTSQVMKISGDVEKNDLTARVKELGYGLALPQEEQTQKSLNFFQFMWERPTLKLALLAALLVLPGLVFKELLPGLGIESVWLDVSSVAAMLLAGYPVMRSAWASVKINKQINMNVLMSVAAIGAVLIGAYTEAGVVMVLFAISEAMEGFTMARARQAIKSLMEVAPQEATLMNGQVELVVPVNELKIGDMIVVKPGERIPMDGRVAAGFSSINQAPITGESQLIDKQPGDTVFASTVNGQGTLKIEVTHLAADNTVTRMIRMVEEAQEKRAPTQRFVDQFAGYYTPIVMGIALLTATIPPLFFGQPFLNPDANTFGWLYRGLALLVVACPCALVISTPVSLVSAISSGAKNGVLFKGGAFVETLSKVKAMAFDKTGTITKGNPDVVSVRSVGCTDIESGLCEPCDDLLALASAVEQHSEHPLAQAIMNKAEERSLKERYPVAEMVTAISGRGVTGEVNGQSVTIGSHNYFDENIPHDRQYCIEADQQAAQGFTTMMVSSQAGFQGYISVADTLRGNSKDTITALKNLGIDDLVMLTGDNESAAHKIAAQVGLTSVRANSLPEDKVSVVEEMVSQHEYVAMIGDGINDTPALAAASVGIAIGNTAQAMETADITLMSNDLSRLPYAVRLSKKTMRTIKANVFFSIATKAAFMILVVAGLGTMWMAVLADMGVSVIVTLNGMRLLGYKNL